MNFEEFTEYQVELGDCCQSIWIKKLEKKFKKTIHPWSKIQDGLFLEYRYIDRAIKRYAGTTRRKRKMAATYLRELDSFSLNDGDCFLVYRQSRGVQSEAIECCTIIRKHPRPVMTVEIKVTIYFPTGRPYQHNCYLERTINTNDLIRFYDDKSKNNFREGFYSAIQICSQGYIPTAEDFAEFRKHCLAQ
ncbi:MAG: hypothetical protein CEN91_314 [Candidatus Berkelbacteria bacterium Licking1014_85]|uniref:Uncharacterized protein n=1 Tax=Candidatus Berkelbacteria bacterium Licking1014_85 TaxID=2017148 RepID=A0A554LJK0_9BACT|nr:MAG: hypothetical protein CEN91_314 [Candidatus Berkelbacteria bacterium Licking1014_85]